ncbi:MAG: hypothetical protein Q9166_007484 [cf. Caloplaca sp. 2 TL-2023]
MADPDLQEIHDFLVELAQKAGPRITSANPSTVDTKKNSSDLVTETDKAVEDLISSSCHSAYPNYTFLGEETSKSGRLTSSPTFVVDPIDGTTNFVHAHAYVSISMAFVVGFKPVVGVVYNPFTQHLYTAIRGQGAFLTAPKIPSSFPSAGNKVESMYEKRKLPLRSPPAPLPDLSHALVAIEYGNERSGNNWECKIATFNALGRSKSENNGAMVQSVRSLGSAALNCCAVARGDVDVYWEGGCWAWDVAAGWIIVEEAGGMVVGGNKGEWMPKIDGRRYLVLRAGAGKEVVGEFWSKIQAPRVDPPNDLFSSSDLSSILALTPPPEPRKSYKLALMSYHPFLPNGTYPTSANDASRLLDTFYSSISNLISDLTRQYQEKEQKIAFGSKHMWLNFYALGEEGLEWKDLAWTVDRMKGFVKRGMVGRWDGVMWPPGEGKGVRAELKVIERLRGQ